METMYMLLILATFGCAFGVKYDGLVVKFGWSDALADVKYFFRIPRTIHEVEGEGWRRTERPKGPMKELRMYCPPGRMVCPLYDTAGFVAGMQIAVPTSNIDPELKPEKYFNKWTAPATEGEPKREYFYFTQFYANEDSIKIGAGPTAENGATLQDGGVWVQGMDGKMLKFPVSEAEMSGTLFKKQNCVPNMGTHYYYNLTREYDCEVPLLPWFGLYTKGELIGVGFQTVGKRFSEARQRDWFEEVPSTRTAALLAMPHASECALKRHEKYGVISLHIYYIQKPWEIKCLTGDSVDPAPVLYRLALSGVRYANQIGDEIKKIISG